MSRRKTERQQGHSEPDRRAKRSLRWLLLLPGLTVALFVALAAMSFLEIKWRSSPRRRGLSPREISAETLARYRKESEAFGELRKKSREKLTVERLLSLFDPPEKKSNGKDGEGKEMRTLPEPGKVLSDFQALRASAKDVSEQVFRDILRIRHGALAKTEISEDEVSLMERLLAQAVLSIEGPIELSEKERAMVFELIESSLGRPSRARPALLLFFKESGSPDDAPELERLLEKAADPQTRRDLERAVKQVQLTTSL